MPMETEGAIAPRRSNARTPTVVRDLSFCPYPAYKDSGLEWIGDIPSHWSIKAARREYAIQLGKMLQPTASSPQDCETPYLKAQHVQWESVRTTELPTMYADFVDHVQYGVDNGDLLVCEGGEVGRAGIVRNPPPGCIIQNALHRVRSVGTSDISFLAYLLKHASSQDWISVLCNRATIAHFTSEKLGDLLIPWAPLSEQRTIVGFLDRKTAKIDALVAKQGRLVELLEERRRALVTTVVTKGLARKVPTKYTGTPWFGNIPTHWDVIGLSKGVKKFVDYRGKTPRKVSSGVPLVTARNIKNRRIDFSESREYIQEEFYARWMKRGLPEIDDVVVTTEAPLGETAQINKTRVALAQRIILLKPENEVIDGRFLKYHFVSDSGRYELHTRSTGSTALGVKASHLRASVIAVPPILEQRECARYLDSENTKIDRLINKVLGAIDRLTELRTALISAAVTGKIDVREMVE